MQIRRIWEVLGIRMTRTPQRSKSKKAVRSLPVFKADLWAAFFISRLFTLVVMLALSMIYWIYTRKEPFIKRQYLRAVTKKLILCDKIEHPEKNTI